MPCRIGNHNQSFKRKEPNDLNVFRRAVEPTSSYSLLRSKPVPPNGAVLVSLNHLRNFKKLALRQMEANGQMINTEDEPVGEQQK